MNPAILKTLQRGVVIPACPLALTSNRKLDERRQRALFRYYLAAGAGGLAVGVHTTQFAIRNPKFGLFQPVLELAIEEMDKARKMAGAEIVRIAGVCGRTRQAVAEAGFIRGAGYHAALLNLGAMQSDSEAALIEHCRQIARIIPLFGFYLNPAIGGRLLPYSFWQKFAEIENVVAIKIAPFNRYQTLDVVRAIAEGGRGDIALYTGNDDTIIIDLLSSYRFHAGARPVERRIVGGLLGQWAVWTRKAVAMLEQCHQTYPRGATIPSQLIRAAAEVTDVNAAIFDAANDFRGCIPGIHEILRRQGLLKGIWCLNPKETLSPGQRAEIERIYAAYPHLSDDTFVRQHLDEWLR